MPTDTHTERGLLAAVLADPDNDWPRLILADWLDDQGQHDRAEFVRVQIEVAQLYGQDTGHLPDRQGRCKCHGCDLVRRARDLLAPNWPAWCGLSRADWCLNFHPERRDGGQATCRRCQGRGYAAVDALPVPTPRDCPDCAGTGHVSGVGVEFRRGFPAVVSLTLAQFVGAVCGRCEGCGRIEKNGSDHRCPTCRGTGHVGGVAGVLGATCPLESIRLTDREPVGPLSHIVNGIYRPIYAWDRQEVQRRPEDLPPALFDLIVGGEPYRDGRVKTFNEKDDAHLWLARAACALTKRWAALAEPARR